MSATSPMVAEAEATVSVALARIDSIDWLSTGSLMAEGIDEGSLLVVTSARVLVGLTVVLSFVVVSSASLRDFASSAAFFLAASSCSFFSFSSSSFSSFSFSSAAFFFSASSLAFSLASSAFSLASSASFFFSSASFSFFFSSASFFFSFSSSSSSSSSSFDEPVGSGSLPTVLYPPISPSNVASTVLKTVFTASI